MAFRVRWIHVGSQPWHALPWCSLTFHGLHPDKAQVGTHPSRDLALPKSLGARTIWLAHGAGADATSEARSSTGASLVDARVDGLIPDLAKALLSVAT